MNLVYVCTKADVFDWEGSHESTLGIFSTQALAKEAMEVAINHLMAGENFPADRVIFTIQPVAIDARDAFPSVVQRVVDTEEFEKEFDDVRLDLEDVHVDAFYLPICGTAKAARFMPCA